MRWKINENSQSFKKNFFFSFSFFNSLLLFVLKCKQVWMLVNQELMNQSQPNDVKKRTRVYTLFVSCCHN